MTNKIYLAGPISAMDWPDAKAQFNRMAEYAIMQLGFAEVCNPVDHPPPESQLNDEELWQHYMRISVRKLASCNAILLAPNYHISRGARLERYIAKELGLEIYISPYYPEHDKERQEG